MAIGVIFAVVGAVIAIIGIVLLVREWFFLRQAAMVDGTVIENTIRNSTDSDGGTSTTYHAVVQFKTTEGKQVTFTDPLGMGSPSYNKGDAVKVKYDAAKPEHAQIGTALREWALPGFLVLFGGIFFVAGLVV